MENDEVKWAKGDLLSVANDALIAEKLTVYLDVTKLFTSFTDPKVQRQVKQNPKKQEDRLRKHAEALALEMTKIGMRLALLGSDAVVKGYVEWRETSQADGSPKDIVRSFGDLILKMREDLHGQNTATVDDMLGSFIVGKV